MERTSVVVAGALPLTCATHPMASRNDSERRVITWLLALTSVAVILGELFIFFKMGFSNNWLLIILAPMTTLIPLVLYLRGHEWARLLIVVGMVVSIVAYTNDRLITEEFALSILMPSVYALIVADAWWVLGSAVVTYLGLIARGGSASVYLKLDGMLVTALLVGGMALARQLTDVARARAEEQAALLDEERRLLERRVAERTGELAQANAELHEASKSKNLFLAGISHELRTPLNIVLGNAELLRDGVHGPMAPRQLRALITIEESGQHLLQLINDLLDMARLQAGAFSIDRSAISVGDLCIQCARLIRSDTERKGLTFNLDLDPEARRVYGDPQRLRQILLNLLSNAVKFTPAGGRVTLITRLVDERRLVEFVVSDTGIGIAGEQLGKLFQPFSQIDRSLSRAYGGTGLGLALVSQLAGLHGGTAGVASAPGEGSQFWVRLPAEEQGAEPPQPQ